MTDVELLVRETLARHEPDVPTIDLAEVLPVAERTRRRQVVNTIGAGIVAVVIALGAITGVAGILRAEGVRPAIEPTPTIPPGPGGEPTGRVGFPPADAEPSRPEDGDPVITVDAESYAGEDVGTHTQIVIFADGRMIWRRDRCDLLVYAGCTPLVGPDLEGEQLTGWVEQRLTVDTVEMLRRGLIATGYFEHDREIDKPFDDLIDWFTVDVAVDDRIVTVRTISNYFVDPLSSRQTAALSRMEELVADPSATLPDSAFADRRIRAFVPTHYIYAFRWKPTPADLDELPPPADSLVSKACGVIEASDARAIADALDAAHFRRIGSARSEIAYRWGGDQERQQFRLVPLLPDNVRRC